MMVSCKPSAVKENETEINDLIRDTTTQSVNVNVLDEEHEVQDNLELDGGLKINWYEHGEGEKLKAGDYVMIDYKVIINEDELVDGNKLNGKSKVPFIIGFGMQTKGWDLALQELRVGDFAEIFIPSDLARGEKGIPGLIPPNADNILKIRILEKQEPTREIDGNKVWVFEENPNNDMKFGEGKEIEFHCFASTPTTPLYVNTYRNNQPFSLKLEDYGLVPGLKKALINAKKSDRMFILIPSSEAYGSKGYLDLVKPNEDLLYNVLVMNVMPE